MVNDICLEEAILTCEFNKTLEFAVRQEDGLCTVYRKEDGWYKPKTVLHGMYFLEPLYDYTTLKAKYGSLIV